MIGRVDVINGARRDIIELWSDAPLSTEDLDYIKTHDSFTNDNDGKYENFKEVVRHSTWLAQVDPSAVIIQQVNAEKEALIAEKAALAEEMAALITERDKLVAALPTLLEGQSEEVVLQFKEYLPEVKVVEQTARQI